MRTLEIYRIVSSKALDSGEAQNPITAGTTIPLSRSADGDAAKKSGCC